LSARHAIERQKWHAIERQEGTYVVGVEWQDSERLKGFTANVIY